jgi:hypothetical protein
VTGKRQGRSQPSAAGGPRGGRQASSEETDRLIVAMKRNIRVAEPIRLVRDRDDFLGVTGVEVGQRKSRIGAHLTWVDDDGAFKFRFRLLEALLQLKRIGFSITNVGAMRIDRQRARCKFDGPRDVDGPESTSSGHCRKRRCTGTWREKRRMRNQQPHSRTSLNAFLSRVKKKSRRAALPTASATSWNAKKGISATKKIAA